MKWLDDLKSDDYGPDWPRISLEVRVAAGFRCALCKKVKDQATTQTDHIVPRSKGGTNAKSNLRCICISCHEDFTPHLKRARLAKEAKAKAIAQGRKPMKTKPWYER